MEACRLDEGTATEALSRLLAAWLELGDRYRVVVANPSQPDNSTARAREERLGEAIQTADRARPGRRRVLDRRCPPCGARPRSVRCWWR